MHSQKRVSGNQPLSTVSKHLLLGLPLKICRTIPRGLVVQAMDFGASTSGFEARLCHLMFYLFGMECSYATKILATATNPTLLWAPIFHQQEDEDWTVSLSSMQGVFAESSLRKQAWRNPKEGRVGCLHQDIFTRKVTDIAFTSNFCNNYSHPASPASMYLTSPRPRPTLPRPILPHVPYLMSSSPLSRVPLLYAASCFSQESRYRVTSNRWDFVWEIKYWGLRTLK